MARDVRMPELAILHLRLEAKTEVLTYSRPRRDLIILTFCSIEHLSIVSSLTQVTGLRILFYCMSPNVMQRHRFKNIATVRVIAWHKLACRN